MPDTSEELFAKLLEGQKVQSSFSRLLQSSFFLSGRTMQQWRSYFKVEIPSDNLNPQICKEIVAKLARLYQEASGHYALASAELQFMERGIDSSYRNKYTELVAQWKTNPEQGKLPSAQTLENLAKAGLDTVYSATTIASIAKDFWKGIIGDLDTCRKIIENATFNNHIEVNIDKGHA